MNKKQCINAFQWVKAALIAFITVNFLFVSTSYAVTEDLGTIATNVTNTFDSIAQLITAASYVSGLGFAVGAILKFKAHKDNPQQVTVGVPIALMFVAAALIFLPSIFTVSGQTLFGSSGGVSAGVTGITTFSVA